MKILSVKILGEAFRSLAPDILYLFNHHPRKDRLSTKIFAGLNGSGKSNFLELFSEIFYYLEIYHVRSAGKTERLGRNVGFEIEYLLPADSAKIYTIFQNEINNVAEEYIQDNLPLTKYGYDEFRALYNDEIEQIISTFHINRSKDLLVDGYIQVKVAKQVDEFPTFSIKRQDESGGRIEVDSRTELLLPKRVVAYTSGQNELLSNPYLKIRYHYFKEFADTDKSGGFEIAEENRLFYLDYNNNFSIFVANMLLADAVKLKYLADILNIEGLTSFRITINLRDIYKKAIPISDRLMAHLRKLQSCSTSWIKKVGKNKELLVLDYFVTDATKSAFLFHFGSAFNLFKVFYELDILNLHLIRKDIRNLMLRVHKHFNFADELHREDPSRLVFRIEQIKIAKRVNDGEVVEIFYKGLSDGEHQFNEVIGTSLMMEQDGCLFLMDEPDTHFNPKWRAKMIEMFNFVNATTFAEKTRFKLDGRGNRIFDSDNLPAMENYLVPLGVRRQEIIMTTHSPFIVSDSLREDVYKFDKIRGRVTYMNPKIETYGASVGLLLQEIFDRPISISDLSNFDITEWRQTFMEMMSSENIEYRIPEIRQKINDVKSHLIDFGESIEKFDLFNLINQIEKDINKYK